MQCKIGSHFWDYYRGLSGIDSKAKNQLCEEVYVSSFWLLKLILNKDKPIQTCY